MTRQEFEAIIKEINDEQCYSVHDVDECELFDKAEAKLVKDGLNVDKHRWYERSTSVYKVGDWFLGVTGVSALFSESMSFDDCMVLTTASEMEEVQSVTYVAKKD